MAELKAADKLAKGGQPHQSTGLSKNPVESTLAEQGIDKNLADKARKMKALVRHVGLTVVWLGLIRSARNSRNEFLHSGAAAISLPNRRAVLIHLTAQETATFG